MGSNEPGNHPLSIEAIFPTERRGLWQRTKLRNHPLSIEAIFPTGVTITVTEGSGR